MSDKKVRLDELEPSDFDGEKSLIVSLYTSGQSVRYISEATGRSQAYVSKILHQVYEADKAERDLRVFAHSATLQWLMRKTIDRIEKSGDRWVRQDAELYLKLRDAESRLKGLDQPTKVEANLTVEHTYTDEELAAELGQYGIQISFPTTPPLALPEKTEIEDAQFELKKRPVEGDVRETSERGG